MLLLEVDEEALQEVRQLKSRDLLAHPPLPPLPQLVDALSQLARDKLLQLVQALYLLVDEGAHQQLNVGPNVTVHPYLQVLRRLRLLPQHVRVVDDDNLALRHFELA